MRNDSAVNEAHQQPDLIRIENDKLGKDPFRSQPVEEFSRGGFRCWIGEYFPDGKTHCLGPEFPDQAHLLLRTVKAAGLGGDLNHQTVSHLGANSLDGGPVGRHVQNVGQITVPDMQMEHGRCRLQTLGSRSPQFSGRRGQIGMVPAGLACPVGGDAKNRRRWFCRGHASLLTSPIDGATPARRVLPSIDHP